MKVKDVIGKRIVEVRQTRRMSNVGFVYEIHGILLDDGTWLVPTAYEAEDQPIPSIVVEKAVK